MSPNERSPLLKHKERTVAWTYAELLAPPIVLLAVGILVLAFTENWSVLTCAYVITQIITTIGYGDFHARTTAAKIFMAVFAVVMLIFAAYVIGVFSDTMLKRQSEAIRRYLRRLDLASDGADAKEASGDSRRLVIALASCICFVLFGTILFHNLESCTCGAERLDGCLDPDYATCVSSGGYVKSASDAFFMSVMTLATIGFGDYQPRSVWGRVVAIPWMFFGVATFANSITTVAAVFYERRKSKTLMDADGASSSSQAVFHTIDRDGKGYLDRNEFLMFTLLKYDVISEDLVDAIFKDYEHFEGAKSGRVTYSMITDRHNPLSSAVQKNNHAV